MVDFAEESLQKPGSFTLEAGSVGCQVTWSRNGIGISALPLSYTPQRQMGQDSNPQPSVLETDALPLSYPSLYIHLNVSTGEPYRPYTIYSMSSVFIANKTSATKIAKFYGTA